MPINFNFSPAGLAAIIASRAGLNQAESDAIARARQQQQDDRTYQLQQEQQATQDDRELFDRANRTADLQGRLANIYSDNQRQDQQLNNQQWRDTNNLQLQRDELTQRQKFEDARTVQAATEETRRQAADKTRADQAAAKAASDEQFRRDKMVQQADQWSQQFGSRNDYHQQIIQQKDVESQRKTQVAMAKVQAGSMKLDPVQVKRFNEGINAAENYYHRSRDALNAYLNQVKSGAVMDSMEATAAKVHDLQSEIEKASDQVSQAHEQYQAFLDSAPSAATPAPTVPAGASPPSVPAGSENAGPLPNPRNMNLQPAESPGQMIPPDVASEFFQAANGDPALARKIAYSYGWRSQ